MSHILRCRANKKKTSVTGNEAPKQNTQTHTKTVYPTKLSLLKQTKKKKNLVRDAYVMRERYEKIHTDTHFDKRVWFCQAKQ